MNASEHTSPVWDTLNIDLVVKVLSHTLFGPFFLTFIPIFYWSLGYSPTGSIIVSSTAYCAVVALFWFVKWCSRLYANQASLFFAPPPVDWSEELVVITGGASGIGELIANTLAVRSVTVVVLDVKPIVTENYNIAYYKCDVSNWEEVQAVSKKVIEELGHPTILINNAGVVQGKLILDLSPEDIKQTFDTNVLAHFWTLKAFLPGMIQQKRGHIVTVSSVMSQVGCAQMSDYSASKSALQTLHASLRAELDTHYAAPSIRTSLLLLGHVHTPLFSTTRLPPPQSPLARLPFLYHFLFPSLHPVDVAKAVIRALDEQHSVVVRLPWYVNFVGPAGELLPSFGWALCKWVTGADWAMEGFVKVSGRREGEEGIGGEKA
ncbi:retinal short-chain dehydrogenase reductase [Neolentinus lepideus HHB14362 ss-1]|uniref:Short-chain dehydrogenase/reductase 3 n=1 Tax=Neolentinus lepideus HHB14362 ss-1 TaxID=1314782 RepID=A0A165V6Z4_9AGAM|nr:retinal short-chain dehydrogenase reductase [Neolentinus lepideus HHB14362 ss-1]